MSEKTSKKKSKGNKKRLIYNICIMLLAFIFVGSAAYLIKYFYDSKKSEDRVDDLKKMIVEDTGVEQAEDAFYLNTDTDAWKEDFIRQYFVEIDGVYVQKKFENLYTLNHDFLGWLSIEDTAIDYPVVLRIEDEEFYLHRDFDGNYSAAGTLFMDTSCDAKKPTSTMLIYGHNMQSGKMFHSLLKYEDEEFYKNHKYIQFDTIYGNGIYEVIAAFRTQIYEEEDVEHFKYYEFFDAKSENEFDSYIKECKQLTPYNIDLSAEYGDSLITLSTCAYHVTNGRFVVVAKRIK